MNYNIHGYCGKFYPQIKINNDFMFLVEKEFVFFFEGNNYKYKKISLCKVFDKALRYNTTDEAKTIIDMYFNNYKFGIPHINTTPGGMYRPMIVMSYIPKGIRFNKYDDRIKICNLEDGETYNSKQRAKHTLLTYLNTVSPDTKELNKYQIQNLLKENKQEMKEKAPVATVIDITVDMNEIEMENTKEKWFEIYVRPGFPGVKYYNPANPNVVISESSSQLQYKIKTIDFSNNEKGYLPIVINSKGDTYLVNKDGTASYKERESTILHYDDSLEDATKRLVAYYKLLNKPKHNDKYIDVDIKAEVEKSNQTPGPQKIDYDSIEYLNSLPKVWELKGNTTYYLVDNCSNVKTYLVEKDHHRSAFERNSLTTEKQAEQIRALTQLLVMRDVYNNGWIPDWNNDNHKKYCIYLCSNKTCVGVSYFADHILAFPTEKLRNLFLVNFSNLIEEAGDLIC